VAVLRKLRGCMELKEKEEMIKDIYKRREERRYGRI